ncbi:hypothetical protein L7F22_005110 [Adiantum nelumboides]|nr:hypothetical protein [Adiantum nelumboides]
MPESKTTVATTAEEKMKLNVANDAASLRTWPCEWFVCDEQNTHTRLFVIQGSESLASWQANLFFEPTQFEGLNVFVHHGIYEAAKALYDQGLLDARFDIFLQLLAHTILLAFISGFFFHWSSVSTAANICQQQLPLHASDLVIEAVHILTNLLQYQDSKAIGLVLVNNLNGAMISQISLNSSTYTWFSSCCREFALLNISSTIKDILAGSGVLSSSTVSPLSAARSPKGAIPLASPSSSSDEGSGYSSQERQIRGHQRSYATWKRSSKLKKFKEGGKNISFLTYDGTFGATDKVLAFIQQFDAAFGDEGFTESSKLRHVAMHFQKSARQWWASLRANGEVPKTWKALRASIMKQFLASDAKDKVLTEWRSLKLSPYESIHKYVDKFWDLHLKATVYKKIDFEEQKQQFCVGLPEDMNEYVNSQRPRSISAVIHHTMVAAKVNFQQGAKRNLKPMEAKEKQEYKGKNLSQNSSKGNSNHNKAKEKGVFKVLFSVTGFGFDLTNWFRISVNPRTGSDSVDLFIGSGLVSLFTGQLFGSGNWTVQVLDWLENQKHLKKACAKI